MKIAKHDEYARQFLADLTVAREFLEYCLRPKIKAKCDFTKLTLVSTSSIESSLKTQASEIMTYAEVIPKLLGSYLKLPQPLY